VLSFPDPIKVSRQVDGAVGDSSDDEMTDDKTPTNFDSVVLQKHINSALQDHLNAKLNTMLLAKKKNSRRLKISLQVDGTAGDTSDEDGSDISDDQ
jgi:hypothetical protein